MGDVDKNVLLISVVGIVAVFGILVYLLNPGATGNATSALSEYKSCLDSNSVAFCMCQASRERADTCSKVKGDNEGFQKCVEGREKRPVESDIARVNQVRSDWRVCKGELGL